MDNGIGKKERNRTKQNESKSGKMLCTSEKKK